MGRKKAIAAFCVGAAAAVVGLWVIPAASSELGPATVGVRAQPGWGETHIKIPPLGTVSADTQRSPIAIEIALQNVRIEQLGPLATSSEGREQLQSQVEADLRPLIVRSGVRTAIGMVVIGVIAGALFFRRELWPTVTATAGAFVAAAGILVAAGTTYDIDGFREPRYTGSLQQARGVIDALQQNAGLLNEAADRYEIATQRAAALLTMLAQPNEDPLTRSTAILHVSDIHGNPIGLDVTEQLAREFEVDAIVDTGDLASSSLDTGELSKLSAPLERSLIQKIEDLPAPYIFVAGNHDSFDLRRALATADNVRYLDRETTQIGLVEFLGWADPTYSPEAVDPSEKAEARLEEAADVAVAVEDTEPDVLLVHDPRLAADSIDRVPMIMAGHRHERAIEETEDTISLTVGSTGATGLKSFTIEADLDYEAEIVYFEGADAVAADYLRLRSLGSEFILERTTFPS